MPEYYDPQKIGEEKYMKALTNKSKATAIALILMFAMTV